eukprot:6548706-Pyramimonas_sp.AAC.1
MEFKRLIHVLPGRGYLWQRFLCQGRQRPCCLPALRWAGSPPPPRVDWGVRSSNVAPACFSPREKNNRSQQLV